MLLLTSLGRQRLCYAWLVWSRLACLIPPAGLPGLFLFFFFFFVFFFCFASFFFFSLFVAVVVALLLLLL